MIIEDKDLNLKLMCKILYSKMGYNTHYEIKLRNKSYISSYKVHDVSDIDVFGYSFKPDLSLYTVGSECKSGETNAIDEFYKFFGISKFYHLNKAYLLKTKIHQNARQIALQNDFVCLSEAELRKMLLGFNINIDKLLKIENAKYKKHNKYLNIYKNKSERLIDYIQLDFWNKENWRNIHNIIHIIKQTTEQKDLFNEITLLDKYIYYYVAELFTYSILKNSSEAIVLNYADFDSAFGNCLYGGAEALNEKRKIHDAVNIATQKSSSFEPEWQSELVNICSRLSQSTPSAAYIPNLLKDIYENCFYTEKLKIDSKVLRKYPDLTRKFTQDILYFINKFCALDDRIFIDFMKF
jgi:hypothetical protein